MRTLLSLALLLALSSCGSSNQNRYPDGAPYPDGRRQGKVVVAKDAPIVIGGVTVPARVYDPDRDGKFTVCHKRKKSIEIARPAVDAHVRHGDYLGACGRPLRYDGYEAHYERSAGKDRAKDKRGKGQKEGRGKKKD